MVPLAKPGRDTSDPNNKRPTSLLNSLIEIMEGVVYQRLLPILEPQLDPSQFAYRRARGAEQLLASMMDIIHRSLLEGKYVYVASFDMAGASG